MTTIEIVFNDTDQTTIDQTEAFQDQLNLLATFERIIGAKAAWVTRPRNGVGKVCLIDGCRTRFAEVRFWNF